MGAEVRQLLELLPKGSELGGCRVERLLGAGGMGAVFLATQLKFGRTVALKVLPPDEDKTAIERFLREASICSRVDHPNVVTIYDAGQERNLYYIVMQYVRGKNLAQWMQPAAAPGAPLPPARPIEWKQALRVIAAAAQGLHAVHEQGMLHRDVKPSNIMLSDDRRVVLMDFGLAREHDSVQLTQTAHVVGTPAFMSPEQCLGQPLTARSDVYSLGSTLYNLLTGKLPFTGTSYAQVAAQICSGQRPRPVWEVNPEVPRNVQHLIDRAMALQPADRFESAAVLTRAIVQALKQAEAKPAALQETQGSNAALTGGHSVLLPQIEVVELVSADSPWDKFTSGRLLVVAAGVLSLALVLFLGWWALREDPVQVVQPQPSEDPQPPLQAVSPSNTEGMIRVEAGVAKLGNDPQVLRDYLNTLDSLDDDDDFNTALDMLTREIKQETFVHAFWIDQYEVTNEEYAEFLAASPERVPPEDWDGRAAPAGRLKEPVRNVFYDDAEAYAQWRGKRLPTVEQWMRAYRGSEPILYAWGDAWDASLANVNENKQFARLSPVEATPRDVTWCGVYNMVGNVAEMTRGLTRYQGLQVVRVKGAGYNFAPGEVYAVGCSTYYLPRDTCNVAIGFRCVIED